jgi:hypothetical protein
MLFGAVLRKPPGSFTTHPSEQDGRVFRCLIVKVHSWLTNQIFAAHANPAPGIRGFDFRTVADSFGCLVQTGRRQGKLRYGTKYRNWLLIAAA